MTTDDNGSIPASGNQRSPSYSTKSINFKYVQLAYHYLISHLLILFLIPFIAVFFFEVSSENREYVYKLWYYHIAKFNLVSATICAGIVSGLSVYMMKRPRTVYLVDFSCYRPPSHLQVSFELLIDRVQRYSNQSASSIVFQQKILERSGLGEETCVPEGLHCHPPDRCLAMGRKETEEVMFGALDILFSNTNVKPEDIGILVVNCSLFNHVPSLSSMIINKYKLRSNIKSFSLGGMGCSAGVIAIDLAKDLLQAHRDTYAIVLSTENLTLSAYDGNNKSMMVTNCLFRVGGAAILLSNKFQDKRQAKYKLVHIVRTHFGSNDEAFTCVRQDDDEAGPLVLPISEQLRFITAMVIKKLCKNPKIKTYIPDFKLAFEHFCIHAGGRAIVDEMENNLNLSPAHVEPSRMTLHRFGNTSSSSIWYELAYMEAKGRMCKNDRVWQIALGSGFKCNSAVWVALKNVKSCPKGNPWEDCIHKYPV
ncbi:hypothetical protein C5167_048451 [Papaver somniferum]|uniref:3-ketoacyl-CoA synthase n=1 Tax=Papaver somniferum TaxID=3469 RepID=A0A4Y7KM68_PAPSO|nr:hypothetical protein C5167_048451 [Papaver somniferum]